MIGPQPAEELLSAAMERWDLSAKRVLVIVPDGTRTAPIPRLCRALNDRCFHASRRWTT